LKFIYSIVLFSRQIEKREREREREIEQKKNRKEKGQEKKNNQQHQQEVRQKKVLCMYPTNIDKFGFSLFSLFEYI
jgi:hypothetical protein